MNLYFRIYFSIENKKCASFIEWTLIAECFEYDSSYGKYTALLKKKEKKNLLIFNYGYFENIL